MHRTVSREAAALRRCRYECSTDFENRSQADWRVMPVASIAGGVLVDAAGATPTLWIAVALSAASVGVFAASPMRVWGEVPDAVGWEAVSADR